MCAWVCGCVWVWERDRERMRLNERREREKKKENKENFILILKFYLKVCVRDCECVCERLWVCVCVWERERKRVEGVSVNIFVLPEQTSWPLQELPDLQPSTLRRRRCESCPSRWDRRCRRGRTSEGRTRVRSGNKVRGRAGSSPRRKSPCRLDLRIPVHRNFRIIENVRSWWATLFSLTISNINS